MWLSTTGPGIRLRLSKQLSSDPLRSRFRRRSSASCDARNVTFRRRTVGHRRGVIVTSLFDAVATIAGILGCRSDRWDQDEPDDLAGWTAPSTDWAA